MARTKKFSKDQILTVINQLMVKNGVPPTVDELRQALGIGSDRTVIRYLNWLEEEGVIERWRGARGMRLRQLPLGSTQTVSVPIVGNISAGSLMTGEENIEGFVRLPKEFIGSTSASIFMLRVCGDSMNQALIHDESIEPGDMVLVKQQPTAQAGDIVVALVDGEATIKRFQAGKGYFVLKPESSNPAHQPIILNQDFAIQGVVCRVLKNGSELLNLVYN